MGFQPMDTVSKQVLKWQKKTTNKQNAPYTAAEDLTMMKPDLLKRFSKLYKELCPSWGNHRPPRSRAVYRGAPPWRARQGQALEEVEDYTIFVI